MRVVSLAVVLVALVATIGVFTFAQPRYHGPRCDGCKTLHFPEAKPPVNGWLFADATPGFHFGEHHDEWRMSRVVPRDVPRGAGILAAMTTGPTIGTDVLYVPRNGCLGVRLRDSARTTLCEPRASVVFVAYAVPKLERGWNMFLLGAVRSDVTNVTVDTVRDGAPPLIVYDRRTPGWWGSWTLSTGQPVPWNAVVRVYNRIGLMATVHVHPSRPGDAIYCASALRGVCGISAQRRS